jgi:hypothetical protein
VNLRGLKIPIIAVVSVHSFVLGLAMIFCPLHIFAIFRWEHEGSVFFPAQAGVFLILLSGAYLAGTWIKPFAWFLVVSKAVAVTFLVSAWSIGLGPNLLLIAALLDGLMGAAVLLAISRKPGP